jgi:phage shock protein A
MDIVRLKTEEEIVVVRPGIEKEKHYELVKEVVETFTIAQVDSEIAQLENAIMNYQARINELTAKKSQAEALTPVEEIKP